MEGNFSGKVLILGAGSVAQCALPLVLKHIASPNKVVVMDMDDKKSRIQEQIKLGVSFVKKKKMRS